MALRDMTLAVILGLWYALAPGFVPAGTVDPWQQVTNFQASSRELDSQESSKPESSQTAPESKPGDAQQPAATEPAAQKPEPATRPAPAPAPKKHSRKKKKKRPADSPEKVVIRNGSTSDPIVDLSPSLSRGQAANQRATTNQLLAATESNLKQISERNLNVTQQETVKQIRTYMDQARKALDSDDVERGHNLAFKAHLLSDDLVKH
jgi:hypothetical protein